MIKSSSTKSTTVGSKGPPRSPVVGPMPKTGTAARIVPNPITTFTNESMPAPRLGSMSVNPGKAK